MEHGVALLLTGFGWWASTRASLQTRCAKAPSRRGFCFCATSQAALVGRPSLSGQLLVLLQIAHRNGQRLLELYNANPRFVQPKSKYNEVYNVVADWTPDQRISVSRARVPWGIPWPGDPTHTVYVWFEALINYLSATGFPEPGFDATWPADLHVIGPDILRFHAALWPVPWCRQGSSARPSVGRSPVAHSGWRARRTVHSCATYLCFNNS